MLQNIVNVLKDLLLFVFWTLFTFCIGVYFGSTHNAKEKSTPVEPEETLNGGVTIINDEENTDDSEEDQ